MNLGMKHPRSDVAFFSVRWVGGLWSWLSAIMSDAIFDALVRRCVPGFSAVPLLFLPLSLVRIYGDIFRDYGNILLFINLWPTRFSSHRHCLLESVISVMSAKWFSNCVALHLLVPLQGRVLLLCTPCLFIYTLMGSRRNSSILKEYPMGEYS